MKDAIQMIHGAFLPPGEDLLIEDQRVEVVDFDGVVVAGLGSEVYAHPGVCVRPELGSTVHLAPGACTVDDLDGALERADYAVTTWTP